MPAKKKSAAKKPKAYHWFQGDSVMALVSRLSEYGATVARLEVHTKGDQMFFVVKGADGHEGPDDPINNSHICPPFCS